MPVTNNDVLIYHLNKGELDWIKSIARQAEIGGRSNVRTTDRQQELKTDQLVGQIGCYVGSMYLSGGIEGYRISRDYANRYATQGDQGSDYPGLQIDFKASLVRTNLAILEHRLPVRPAELHKDTTYILVLITSLSDISATVALAGWARAQDFSAQPEAQGVFAGAHVLKAHQLNPMMPMPWWKNGA